MTFLDWQNKYYQPIINFLRPTQSNSSNSVELN